MPKIPETYFSTARTEMPSELAMPWFELPAAISSSTACSLRQLTYRDVPLAIRVDEPARVGIDRLLAERPQRAVERDGLHARLPPDPLHAERARLAVVHGLDRPELKDPVFQRVTPARLDPGGEERIDIFSVWLRGFFLVT